MTRTPRDNSERAVGSRNLFGTTLSVAACRALSVLAASAGAVLGARQLGPSGRGSLVLLLTLAPFTAVLCSFGINLAGRVLMVAPEDPIPIGQYFGLGGVLAVLELVVCAVVGALLLPLAGVHLSPTGLALFGMLGATALAQSVVNDALNTFGMVVRAAATELAGFGLQVALIVGLVLSGTDRFQPYAIAVMISGWCQLTLALLSLRRIVPSMRPHGDRRNWLRLVRSGWPAIPSAFSQLLTFRVDRYLVSVVMSPAAVGVYSVAATLPEVLRIIPMALGQSAFYRVASGTATKRDFDRPRAACMALVVALGVVAFLAAPLAVRILFGPEFLGAVTPLRILLLAEVAMTIFTIDGSILAGLNRLSDGAKASVVGLAVVLVADLLLIPRYGLAGAAWASVLAYTVMSLIVRWLLRTATAEAPTERSST